MSNEIRINADEFDAWIANVFDENAKRKEMHLKNNTEEVWTFKKRKELEDYLKLPEVEYVKITRVLILTDEDLPDYYLDTPIDELHYEDFKRSNVSLRATRYAHVIIYVSERLNDFVFLKNRYGLNGFDNVVIMEK